MPDPTNPFVRDWLEAEAARTPSDPVLAALRGSIGTGAIDEPALLRRLLGVRLLPTPQAGDG